MKIEKKIWRLKMEIILAAENRKLSEWPGKIEK